MGPVSLSIRSTARVSPLIVAAGRALAASAARTAFQVRRLTIRVWASLTP